MRVRYPLYHNLPVAPFGDARCRLLIVGLAPGAHGANATGRPFTGDFAGVLLYKCLHAIGLANQAEAVRANDGLRLTGCMITNAVKCLPPENKPTTAEVDRCNGYLQHELKHRPLQCVILALGTVAHRAVLKAFGEKLSARPFAHGAVHDMPDGGKLVDSYHCSRYNTQTGRLTETMFMRVLEKAVELAHD
jgi:uracil-DNA glycosylase family 4